MLIWSTNTISQSRNTDTATKQYLNSSNSVLHKVQSPLYNTTKHQVTNLKPAANGTMQYTITQHNSNFPFHRHTYTQKLKSYGDLSDSTGQTHKEMESATHRPTPLCTQHKMVTAPVSSTPVLSWSPSPAQPARKQCPPISPAGGCVHMITSNMPAGSPCSEESKLSPEPALQERTNQLCPGWGSIRLCCSWKWQSSRDGRKGGGEQGGLAQLDAGIPLLPPSPAFCGHSRTEALLLGVHWVSIRSASNFNISSGTFQQQHKSLIHPPKLLIQ